jgi:hypothetical protein
MRSDFQAKPAPERIERPIFPPRKRHQSKSGIEVALKCWMRAQTIRKDKSQRRSPIPNCLQHRNLPITFDYSR